MLLVLQLMLLAQQHMLLVQQHVLQDEQWKFHRVPFTFILNKVEMLKVR